MSRSITEVARECHANGVTAVTLDSDGNVIALTLDPQHEPHDGPQQTNQPSPPPAPAVDARAEERRIATAATGRPVKLVGAND